MKLNVYYPLEVWMQLFKLQNIITMLANYLKVLKFTLLFINREKVITKLFHLYKIILILSWISEIEITLTNSRMY
jgi:hypothetical protein